MWGAIPLLLVVALAGIPAAAWAQAAWYFTPRLSLSEEYNDNITFQVQKTDDFITRLTPGFTFGYESAPLLLLLRYDTTFELYADNSDLNNVGDHQAGRLIFRYLPNPRLSLGLDGGYVRSLTTPGLLATQRDATPPDPSAPSVDAGQDVPGVAFFDLGRQQTESYSISPSMGYQIDPLTTVTANYAYTHLDVENDPSQSSHSAIVGVNRVVSPRATATGDYTFRYFTSDREPDAFTSTSHAVTVGGIYQVTERLTVNGRAGPNLVDDEDSDSSVTAEVEAGVFYRLRDGALGLSYRRTQALVVGAVTAQTVDRVVGRFFYQVTRELGVYVLPGATFTQREEGTDLHQYEVEAGVSYRLTRTLSAFARYLFVIRFEGPTEVTQHIFSVGLAFRDTYRVY